MHKYVLLLHVLSATVWTGGHLVLTLTILPRVLKERSATELLRFEGAYEKVGMPALVIQVLSGLWLAYEMIPDLRSWVAANDRLSQLIVFKLLLLLLTVLIALDARLRLIPRLSTETLPAMARRIVAVTLLSVLFVVTGVSFRAGPFL
jgi:putative copper export protein